MSRKRGYGPMQRMRKKWMRKGLVSAAEEQQITTKEFVERIFEGSEAREAEDRFQKSKREEEKKR